MLEEIKNIKTGKKELRSFGITIGIILYLMHSFFTSKPELLERND